MLGADLIVVKAPATHEHQQSTLGTVANKFNAPAAALVLNQEGLVTEGGSCMIAHEENISGRNYYQEWICEVIL